MGTKIRWSDETWNPIAGCSHVSPGCKFCYAESLSLRFGRSGKPWTAQNAAQNVILHPERLRKPYSWKQPSRVFVNSMSDNFHELVPFDYVDRIFAVMLDTPQHTYQLLTKRPARQRDYMNTIDRLGSIQTTQQAMGIMPHHDVAWPPLNIWIGTSVEDARRARERIPLLQETQGAVRFLSCEPLLGDLGVVNLDGIHWVIAGGESGNHMKQHPERWMDHAWARSLRDQCVSHSPVVSYFFKQSSGIRTEMGTELIEEDGSRTTWEQYPDEPLLSGQLSLV